MEGQSKNGGAGTLASPWSRHWISLSFVMTVQNAEKTADSRRETMSTSRGSVEKQATLKTVSPSSERRETTTTTKFERDSPEVSTAGNMNAAAAAAAAAALSHQRMLMSPLPFDRVSSSYTFSIELNSRRSGGCRTTKHGHPLPAGKYITYNRSGEASDHSFFAAAKICRQTDIDR